jgi:hypothetical protein
MPGMRAWRWTVPLAIVTACGAACGGNVVVDSGGTATSGSGTTSSGTSMAGCKKTCLEAIKQGGGVCAGAAGLSAFTSFAGCGDLNCPSVCMDLGASGASASCFDCMSSACPNELSGCTVS